MKIGYCRTSTLDQKYGFETQLEELENTGCEKIFKEQVSSIGEREQLKTLIDFARDGDSVIVTKLDRLARSISHLWSIIGQLQDKNVNLVILNMGIDTSTATGKLMLTILGGISEFEREMMLERQREGIQRAKLAGKYKGRKRLPEEKRAEIVALREAGKGPTTIARETGVSRITVYRVLEEQQTIST